LKVLALPSLLSLLFCVLFVLRQHEVRSTDCDHRYFESNLNILLANMLPWLTARKAWQCRERFVDAMEKFARSGGYEEKDCSELARARRDTQREGGATIRDTARLEMSLNIGVLSNTVPSTFWYIFDIFSRPDLLAAIRRELEQNAVVVPDPSAPNKRAVDISLIRGDCPLLVAAFQETLRLHSNGAPIRFVYDDVVLDNQFLLKKGSILQMSAPVIHSEQTHWGLDASKFDATRFDSNVAIAGQKATTAHTKPRATSYMAWGASPNLCPGRHFATAEILATAAMLILRTDITPVKGHWWSPKLNSNAMAAAMSPPGEAYPVRLQRRKEVEGVEWSFIVSGQKDKFGLITG
jgi:cytochrome P450